MGDSRRGFLRTAGLAGGGLLRLSGEASKVKIFLLSTDTPIQWAAGELQRALQERGIDAALQNGLEGFEASVQRIVVVPGKGSGVILPTRPESVAILSIKFQGRDALVLSGSDVRGVVYAVLELTDRVRHAENPQAELSARTRLVEQPANAIRSVQRLFCSEVEDKGWYHDKAFWSEYLSMLVAQRFNRFSLTLGLGYDLPRNVLDSYFIFSYPFLLREVPGYKVTVPGLPPDEPDRNLAMLQWISSETARRGLHFQLSLWSQTYKWIESPKANYVIAGLDDENHARYCRDALKMLIRECPAISGITLRAHSESGIADGSYEFWKVLFTGIAECGRRMELDLHSKGIDHRLIAMALETKQPVRVSAKYTAEHMGLPGHQIAIRELERKRASSTPQERSFTRYGYADYLAEDRTYGTYFRLWPGKDRVVLWGDPAIAAGYGRYSSICGALGLEICEPMSFKARQGSGRWADRRIYADPSLAPKADWQKYLYTYRLWGRHLYNPDADPESYRRYLHREYGAAAAAVEAALSNASKVIPLVTSAHLPSGAGMTYWPEIYSNMPVADEKQAHIYGDTPSPKVFGRVSPLDPGLFLNAYEYAEELTGGVQSGRYSPSDVARWLDAFAAKAEEQIGIARARAGKGIDASFRRVAVDVQVQLGLGRFFAAKMRSAVAWALYQKDATTQSLRDALFYARAAREAWKGIVAVTKGVYLDDLAFGDVKHRRGSWADRLPAIEQDVRFLERLAEERGITDTGAAQAAWLQARRDPPEFKHTPPETFVPNQPLVVRLSGPAGSLEGVRLHYRHVNQAESYEVQPMSRNASEWRCNIPADYTNSRYAIQYYYELIGRDGTHWLWPGLNSEFSNQPYFVVRRSAARV